VQGSYLQTQNSQNHSTYKEKLNAETDSMPSNIQTDINSPVV